MVMPPNYDLTPATPAVVVAVTPVAPAFANSPASAAVDSAIVVLVDALPAVFSANDTDAPAASRCDDSNDEPAL
nr:unnamed protein product [Digitaria exilis]